MQEHVHERQPARACYDFVAVNLNKKVKKWIKLSYQLIFPEKLADLILHLATGGQLDSAIDMAKSVFEILNLFRKRNCCRHKTNGFDEYVPAQHWRY